MAYLSHFKAKNMPSDYDKYIDQQYKIYLVLKKLKSLSNNNKNKKGGEYKMAIKSKKAITEPIFVEVGTLGGEVKKIMLDGDHTISAVLENAGFDPDSEVRINGEAYDADDEVENGDTIMVLAGEKVKGGRYIGKADIKNS